MIIIILTNNLSFAATTDLTNEKLKQSLKQIMTSAITIEYDGNGGHGYYSFSIVEDGADIIVEDSKVRVILKEYNVELDMDYKIQNGKCIFNTKLEAEELAKKVENMSKEEYDWYSFMMSLMYMDIIYASYLSLADALNVDKSLAFTYFNQKTENYHLENFDSGVCSNEIFELKINGTEEIFEESLEVDIEKLLELDSSKIDTSQLICTVTIEEVNNTSETVQNETKNQEENNISTSTVEEVENVTSNQSNNIKSLDNTTAKTSIPNTGKKIGLYCIAIMIGISLITLKSYKKYDDIK